MRERYVETAVPWRRRTPGCAAANEHLNFPRVYIAFASVGLWAIIIGVAKLIF